MARVVVIGAGFAGLSAALRPPGDGDRVTVVERRAVERNGYDVFTIRAVVPRRRRQQ